MHSEKCLLCVRKGSTRHPANPKRTRRPRPDIQLGGRGLELLPCRDAPPVSHTSPVTGQRARDLRPGETWLFHLSNYTSGGTERDDGQSVHHCIDSSTANLGVHITAFISLTHTHTPNPPPPPPNTPNNGLVFILFAAAFTEYL